MRLLILGGTVFLGRHLAREALARGDDVTLFHRGLHSLEAGAFDDVATGSARLRQLRGDRRESLSALDGAVWDAVIDTSGYVPSVVTRAAEALGSRVGHYTFVSTQSVYADVSQAGLTETARVSPLGEDERREGESLDRENPGQLARFHELYGPLKAACERALERLLPAQALIVRPGLIVGPFDPTDRFTYWPDRMARGGDVLAPGSPERPVQFIDARDLAAWMLTLAETRRIGTLHASGPEQPCGMGALLDGCARATGQAPHVEWCDEAFLLGAGVVPWSDLPLWIPERDASHQGFMRIDAGRARAAGLTFRPLEQTVRDTRAWSATRDPGAPRRAGLDAARERDLLDRWRAASRTSAVPPR